jgi:hypothetical protein
MVIFFAAQTAFAALGLGDAVGEALPPPPPPQAVAMSAPMNANARSR